MRTALFIERDGILNLDRVDKDQPVPPLFFEQMAPKTEALEPLRQLKAAGLLLIATTNQPGLSDGSLSRRELDRMHGILRGMFCLDDIFICPHNASDCCPCRRPKTGLLTEAAFKWQVNLQQSFVLSNKWQDAQAAHTAGCISVLLSSPWIGKGHRDIVVANLADVPAKIAQFRPAIRQTKVLAHH